ncbi:MAG: hypothetical protein L3K03_07255 [Thermoplasmata archaeon]|nr:hypothetical protein [Thermoplasmata archaeon]
MASFVVFLITMTLAVGPSNVQLPTVGHLSVPPSRAQETGARTSSLFFFALLTASPDFGYITLGGTVSLNATAYGGNAPLSYAYSGLPQGCASANTSNLNCTPTATGTSTVEVTITDTTQAQAFANATVTVAAAVSTPPPTTPISTGSTATPSLGVYGLILVLFLVLLAGAAWQAFGTSSETPPETPPTPPST